MESSALNVAHQQHRRAEAHLRNKRYDEAIECHKNAAEKLEEAMKLTKATRALESLRLQQDFHIRQQEIVRNIEEADSLLDILMRRGGESGDELESDRSEPEELGRSEEGQVIGSKHPKDEHVVIEELRTLNQQLRSFVMQLIEQLEVKENENVRLKERVKVLETELESKHQAEANPLRKNSLHVITDSTGGNSSPFVFSPCGELSPDVIESSSARELPPLAPLEMPNFDFTIFMRQPTDAKQQSEEKH